MVVVVGTVKVLFPGANVGKGRSVVPILSLARSDPINL